MVVKVLPMNWNEMARFDLLNDLILLLLRNHFIRPDLEPAQGVGSERCAYSHIGRVTSLRHQYTSNARYVVAGVEGVPLSIEPGFKPPREIHRCIRRRHAD